MATQFPAPPVRTPFPDKQWTTNGGKTKVDEAGYPSWGWMKWFQEIAAALNAVTGTLVTSVFGRSGDVVAVSGDYNVSQITGAAPLNSPTFTGVPAGPTAAPGTNTTQLATTAFVLANAVQIIASGTQALHTDPIASGAKSVLISISASGTLTTDNIMLDFNADPSGTTGYSPSASGMLTIVKYPTANTVNIYVYNNTGGSVTPGAVTLNWRVVR